MRVRLNRKLARILNGVDLTACKEGQVMEIGDTEARLLIAEGWASLVAVERTTAHERPRRRTARTRRTKKTR